MKRFLRYCFSLLSLTLLLNKVNAQSLTPPQFPGGEKAFKAFLAGNLKWPKESTDTEGTVFIHFFVEKDGTLSGITVVKGFSSDFDNEAIRVIKISPKWIPARKDHNVIKSAYTVPLKFFVAAS